MVTHGTLELVVVSWRAGARTVVRFDGELDCAGETRARAEIESALALGAPELVIDLRGLTFLDVRGVNVLLGALETCRERQCRLLLATRPGRARRALELCHADGRFEYLEPAEHSALIAA